jgi:hypothetical protein
MQDGFPSCTEIVHLLSNRITPRGIRSLSFIYDLHQAKIITLEMNIIPMSMWDDLRNNIIYFLVK